MSIGKDIYKLILYTCNFYLQIQNMRVKEIDKTANVAWSPEKQFPVYVVAGTAAQQLDATFRY